LENKLNTLNSIILEVQNIEIVKSEELDYEFVDQESNHSSITKYEMVIIRKKERTPHTIMYKNKIQI